MSGLKIDYARVSTDAQDLTVRREALAPFLLELFIAPVVIVVAVVAALGAARLVEARQAR